MRTMHFPALPAHRGRRYAWQRTALLSSMALVGVLGTSLTAVPASAALPTLSGVIRIELESRDNSSTAKSVTATCPPGTRVINAGGYISGGAGSVALNDIYPDDQLTTVTVAAKETDAYSSSWSVTAFATCADEPPGLEWIWAESLSDSDNGEKPVVAACSPGKTVLGTGGTIKGGQGEVVLDEVSPNGAPGVAATEVEAVGVEVDAFSGDWTVNALAICADPVAGQQVLTADSPVGSLNNGTSVVCGAGQVATGSGAAILGSAGEVVMDDAYPRDGSPTTAPIATTVYGQEEDGTANNWSIRAYVLCADA